MTLLDWAWPGVARSDKTGGDRIKQDGSEEDSPDQRRTDQSKIKRDTSEKKQEDNRTEVNRVKMHKRKNWSLSWTDLVIRGIPGWRGRRAPDWSNCWRRWAAADGEITTSAVSIHIFRSISHSVYIDVEMRGDWKWTALIQCFFVPSNPLYLLSHCCPFVLLILCASMMGCVYSRWVGSVCMFLVPVFLLLCCAYLTSCQEWIKNILSLELSSD